MLTYDDFYKQVAYYQGLTGKNPERVYAYIIKGRYTVLVLLLATDFNKYIFIEYTFKDSFYPVVQKVIII
jgi:hypothetical protein